MTKTPRRSKVPPRTQRGPTVPHETDYDEYAVRAHATLCALEMGWDEPTDRPPTPASIGAGISFVKELPSHALRAGLQLPTQVPSLLPECDGGLVFTWATHHHRVSFRIEPDGSFGDFSAIDFRTHSQTTGSPLPVENLLVAAQALAQAE